MGANGYGKKGGAGVRRPFDHKFMLVTDRRACPDGDLRTVVTQALAGGVRCIQLREKDLKQNDLKTLAHNVATLCGKIQASLIINSDVETVLETDAQGIHLTSTGPSISEMRTLMAENRWIGRSTHSLEEALQAQKDGADYVLFGPVFETPSKKPYGPPLGLDALGQVTKKIRIPVLAVGGIHLDNIEGVLRAGASGVALIRAILSAQDAKVAAAEFTNKLKTNV